MARRASSLVEQVLEHSKTMPFDQERMTRGAIGVLRGIAGKITGVNKLQPSLYPDLARAGDGGLGGGRPVEHVIVGVETTYMPRHTGIDRGQEGGELRKLRWIIVESRDEQGRHLDPDPEFPHEFDGIQDRLQPRLTRVLVKLVSKAFEINVGGRQMRLDVADRLGCRITVGDKHAAHPTAVRRGGAILGPFHEDGRFSVGKRNCLRAALTGSIGKLLGRQLVPRDAAVGMRVLANFVVLAMRTPQVATHRGHTERD